MFITIYIMFNLYHAVYQYISQYNKLHDIITDNILIHHDILDHFNIRDVSHIAECYMILYDWYYIKQRLPTSQ